ncbi:MAG: hypothetical protein GEV08_03890 [Acidimicrobiia bacterium]|nr:hypothetical protein [Acidimicrobiia bacterium]
MTSDQLSGALRDLEECWASAGSTTPESLAPGLTVTDAQQLAATVGLTLPDEALTWFGWHNGYNTNSTHAPRDIGCGWWLYSLEETVAWYSRTWQPTKPAPDVADLEEYWSRSYLPFISSDIGEEFLIDLAADEDGRCVVYSANILWNEPNPPAAPSLAAFVTGLVDAIQAGAYVWHRTDNEWQSVEGHPIFDDPFRLRFLHL